MIASWLVGVDLLTLQLWLAESQIARFNLVKGEKEASVGYDGKNVAFVQADLWKLDVAIADLVKAIAALSGVITRKGPIYAAF